MKKIKTTFNVLVYLICSVLLFQSCKEAKENINVKKPNFLFVLVDDQPFDALESSGRYPFLKTPNIQRLQNEGVTFNNYFVTQSICSPSRASFLTGVYPHIHGVNQNTSGKSYYPVILSFACVGKCSWYGEYLLNLCNCSYFCCVRLV